MVEKMKMPEPSGELKNEKCQGSVSKKKTMEQCLADGLVARVKANPASCNVWPGNWSSFYSSDQHAWPEGPTTTTNFWQLFKEASSSPARTSPESGWIKTTNPSPSGWATAAQRGFAWARAMQTTTFSWSERSRPLYSHKSAGFPYTHESHISKMVHYKPLLGL